MSDLSNCRLLVTPTSYARNDPRLLTELQRQVGEVIVNQTGRPLTSTEVAGLLPGCDGYIAGLDVIDRTALQAADRLQVIARYGVGLDNVDLKAAGEKKIVVTYTPGANSVSVAELTLGLMLALARRIPQSVQTTRSGEWLRLGGVSLEGKTIGLLGLGAIGKQVARRLVGFDCRILAFDPIQDTAFAHAHRVELVPLDELLSQADFISLHLPLLTETRALVNTAFLTQMKPGAFLINTARGELIDEPALVEALRSGHLGGAALDVFAQEPPGKDNPLLSLPDVIVTPHSGSHTDGATNAMGWMALHDCLAVLRGEAPRYPVV
jgi:phosphoglycerate dehydrogenase-like enzyme